MSEELTPEHFFHLVKLRLAAGGLEGAFRMLDSCKCFADVVLLAAYVFTYAPLYTPEQFVSLRPKTFAKAQEFYKKALQQP